MEIYQYQQELREKVLSNYMTNQRSLDHYGQLTMGDLMYSRQLLDRNFYRRNKVNFSNKKEARTLDRFE